MSPMTMPKPSEQAKAAFQKLVPPDPAVTTRPMFGNLAGFVNGNMFCGLFGEDLFVRVSDDDQTKVRKQGGRAFEPMPGRAMTGYVVVPAGWQKTRPKPKRKPPPRLAERSNQLFRRGGASRAESRERSSSGNPRSLCCSRSRCSRSASDLAGS